jgi:uncharacterized protein
MAELNTRYVAGNAGVDTGTVAYDEGLRSYMLGIYNYMAAGVALTGVVAYGTAATAMSNPAVAQALYGSSLKWVLMFAPLALVMVLGFGINKMSTGVARLGFFAYAALMGVSISSIFLVFTGASIAQVFFISAATFGAASLIGYTTKRDLTSMGSFLFMGLIGIVIASLVNIFLQSSMLGWVTSIIAVLVFTGLTAYDSQRLKDEYSIYARNTMLIGKGTIMGALSLYLNFINIFMSLLNLMGSRE